MKKVLCFWLFEILIILQGNSQTARPFDLTSLPLTPNAASLGKYGEYPVNLTTGIPDITIPIYTVESQKFSLPISISYHSSGFKVNDVASDIGLGWALNAGGAITRNVIGKPDERSPGGYFFIQGNIYDDPTIIDPINNPFHRLLLYNSASGLYDTQPDEFSFNFNGRAGKFVIKKVQNTYVGYTIPYSDLNIECHLNQGNIDYFIITTEEGIKYQFGNSNLVGVESYSGGITTCGFSGNSESVDEYNSSWYLTQINFPNNSETIDFSYISYNQEIQNMNVSKKLAINLCQLCSVVYPDDICLTTSDISGKGLEDITYKGGRVHFIHSNPRLDVHSPNDQSKSLDAIEIYSSNNDLQKKFILDHSYFFSTASLSGPETFVLNSAFGTTFLPWRLRLDDLYEVDYTGIINPPHTINPYVFNYNSILLPPRFSFAQDYLGFYNCADDNTTLIPPEPNYPVYVGANRNISIWGSKACMLSKITYPTGGYSEFEFENNTYGRYTDGDNVFYQEVTPHPVEVNATSNSSGCLPHPSCLAEQFFTIDYDQDILVTYFHHTVCGGDCEVDISLFNLTNMTINLLPNNVTLGTYIHLTAGNYKLVSESFPGCNPPPGGCQSANGHIKIEYYTLGPIVKTRLAPGLRIKQIKNADGVNSNSDIIKKYSYSYNAEQDRSSGLFVNVFNFQNVASVLQGGNYNYCSCTQLFISAYAKNLGTANGSYVNYSEVTLSTESSTNNGKEINIYEPQTYYNPGSMYYPFAPFIYDEYKNLRLKERIIKDGNDNIVRDIINTYSESSNYISLVGLKTAFDFYAPMFPDPNYNSYVFSRYHYTTLFSYLSSSTERLYNLADQTHSNYIGKQTNFYYDNPNHTNPTRIETVNSDGITETVYNKYAQDFTIPSNASETSVAALTKMAGEKHIHNAIIESIQKKNIGGSVYVTTANFTKFKEWNTGLIRPKEEYSLEISLPLNSSSFSETNIPSTTSGFNLDSHYKNKLSYDKYDDIGNLLQYHKTDDRPISIQWDDLGINQVAQFKGAIYEKLTVGNECSFNGFESQGPSIDDNWHSGSSTIETADPHTGLGYAKIPSNSYGPAKDFSPDDPHQKFIFSCWVKTTNTFIGNSTTYISIYSEVPNTAATFPSSYSGSQPITLISPTNGEWKYLQVVIDLSKIHSYLAQTTGDQPLNLRALVRNGASQDIYVDDIRFMPLPSEAQTLTYNPIFFTQPSSISDNKSLPTFFEYDGFGRLAIVKDHQKKIQKTLDYNYKH